MVYIIFILNFAEEKRRKIIIQSVKSKFVRTRLLTFLLLIVPAFSHLCGAKRVITGDERTELYLPLISGKRVALFSNQTGLVGLEQKHVLDVLVENRANVVAVFSPEHGFRGKTDAGRD